MKTMLTCIALLLGAVGLLAQVNKGSVPLNPQSAIRNPQSTRAVVIGISDYREPLIPDLKFADRDARAFAQWLRSQQGGNLPDSNIVLLENATATNAQMIVSLDWLIEASQPGDRAFIYFSGHGDVERVSKFQRGYLLGSDSPSAVYGAGAFSLNYLQDILSTLSENGVQVIVITDACHAGKLAGSSVNGSQVTSMQLAQQFANEIKIMSCQPEEFSLEGEQWGGGRGCFSFHLEDALYGLADGNADAVVDLRELRRYLEDHVSAEAAPQSQVPMVNGPVAVPVAKVRAEALASRASNAQKRNVPFMDIDNKGLESRMLEATDTTVQRLYAQFLAALDSGKLLQPTDHCADYYFRALLAESAAAPLHGTMKRKLAAALIEEGQTIINRVLKTDPAVLDNIWANRVKYDHLPAYFQRATEILGEKHYAWRDLKAKEYYFKAMTIRKENFPDSNMDWIEKEKMKWLEKSLSIDSNASIVYLESGRTYNFNKTKSVELCKKAISLSPNWALAHEYLGIFSDGKESIKHLKRAIELDSTYLRPYVYTSIKYESMRMADSAQYWARQYIDKFLERVADDSTTIKAYECANLGRIFFQLRDYGQAKEFLLLGEKKSNGKMAAIYYNLIAVLPDLLEFEAAILAAEKGVQIDGNVNYWYKFSGDFSYYFIDDATKAKSYWSSANGAATFFTIAAYLSMGEAEKALSLAIQNAVDDEQIYFLAAEAANQLGMVDSAMAYYKILIERLKTAAQPFDFWSSRNLMFVALSHYRLGLPSAAMALIEHEEKSNPNDAWLSFNLACFYAQIGHHIESLNSIEKAISLGWKQHPLSWIEGTLCDPLLNPIRETDGFKALVKQHFPKYYDIATRIPGKK